MPATINYYHRRRSVTLSTKQLMLLILQVRERSLVEFRKWISSQPHLLGCCDGGIRLNDGECSLSTSFLLRFLRINKFNIPKASAMLDSYVKMKCNYPQWYKGLGELESETWLELVCKFNNAFLHKQNL